MSNNQQNPNAQNDPTTTAKPQAAEGCAAEGRDGSGKFTKGNKGGPGNPFARMVAALRKAFMDNVGPEEMAAIVKAMVAKAKGGDVAAAKVVLNYTIGKPAAAVEPDRLDEEEFEHFVRTTGMYAKTTKMVTEPEPELPLMMLRAVRPAMTGELSKLMGGMLRGEIGRDGKPVEGGGGRVEAPIGNGDVGGGAGRVGLREAGYNRVGAPIANGGSAGGTPGPQVGAAPSRNGKLQAVNG